MESGYSSTLSDNTKIVRKELLVEKVVFVDGQPGCGKTMLAPIISAFDRVELLNYAFEVEFICRLFTLNKIDRNAAIAMVRMLVDHKLYQTMMGRETNFRYSDLSSVFKDSNPWRYFKRIFQPGDMLIPDKIKVEKPILSLTTHDLLSVSVPVLEGLGSKAVLIEVLRHPLYMVKQQKLNMERLVYNPRDIQICVEHENKQLPYFTVGWQEKFVKANAMEKAIFTIEKLTATNHEKRELWLEKGMPIVTIPFEKFVIDPMPFMKKIEYFLESRITNTTKRVMKKQHVPRRKIADSPALAIYKRCGWTPPSQSSESEELKIRRNYVMQEASKEALAVMDKLSEDYTKTYLSH